MVPVMSLWLPILLSAVVVFVASSIIHMVLPYHRSDFKKLPDEEGVMGALRKSAVPPGDYVFPKPDSMKAMPRRRDAVGSQGLYGSKVSIASRASFSMASTP